MTIPHEIQTKVWIDCWMEVAVLDESVIVLDVCHFEGSLPKRV